MVSVTTIIDYFTEPELLAWYLTKGKTYCAKVSEEAKRVGTIVDTWVKADIQGDRGAFPERDEPVTQCILAWQTFKAEHPLFISQVRDVQAEVSRDEVVGHPDFLIQDGERTGVVDLKTSKAIHPKYWTQVAAYAWLKHGLRYEENVFLAILRLDKQTGNYEYQTMTSPAEIGEEIEVFQAYLLAYRHGERVRERIRRLREQEVLE